MGDHKEETGGESLLYHYAVMRADLPPGMQLVQMLHCGGESVVVAPLPDTTQGVALHVRDEVELLLYWEELLAKGFTGKLIREPNPPYNGAAMCFAVTPSTKRNQLRKLFHHLPKAFDVEGQGQGHGGHGAPPPASGND